MNTKTLENVNGEDRGNVRLLRIILGAGSATLLLTFIFLIVGQPNGGGLQWMILPYLCVPAAGALGGLIFDMMQPMRNNGGFNSVLSFALGASIYAILFVVAFILGVSDPIKIFL